MLGLVAKVKKLANKKRAIDEKCQKITFGAGITGIGGLDLSFVRNLHKQLSCI